MRLLAFPVVILMAAPLFAQGKGSAGDLMIMPTRVILEGRTRSAEVVLRNTGTEACVYRVSFQEMQMNADGEVEAVPKVEGHLVASDLVRFTPKQVEIPPGKTQTVRIQLRKPEGLADGEYRSHMVFQGLPPVEAPRSLLQPEESKNVSFEIKTIVALSIPIIVRHGETSVSVELSALTYQPAVKPDEPPAMDLVLGRKGNRSVHGEFKVDWMPASGKVKNLLPVLGSVTYANLDSRRIHLVLPDAKGLQIRKGRLKVTYSYMDVKQAPVVAFLDVP